MYNFCFDSMQNKYKIHVDLPEHTELLLFLNNLFLVTGRLDIMYCNAFLIEAIQLLTNSIFLYEDGFFDCAFYTIRQASEIIDSMFYLSNKDATELKKWSAKEYFPMDKKLKERLMIISDEYSEIRSLIPELFERHDELVNTSQKLIHKQGFDTFYCMRYSNIKFSGHSLNDEMQLFIECLKYTIGIVLVLYIILEPLSLALSDEEISLKIHFNPLTIPIDITYFQKFLGFNDTIDKIKGSKFYKNFISFFSDNESMYPNVFSVVREGFWNVDALDEIENQFHLLNLHERLMFLILKKGICVSYFYFNGGASLYSTSIRSKYDRSSLVVDTFEKFIESKERFNQPYENVFISVVSMYDDDLILEHNELFTQNDIETLKELECQAIKQFEAFKSEYYNT